MVGRVPRRQARHLQREARYSCVVRTLTEMSGYDSQSTLVEGEGPFIDGSFERIRARVDAFGNPPLGMAAADGTLGEHAYFQELLGAHGDYSGESSSVVTISIPSLALPDGLRPAVAAFDNPSVSDSPAADEFCSRYLLPTVEAMARHENRNIGKH